MQHQEASILSISNSDSRSDPSIQHFLKMALYDVEALLDETAKDVKMDDAPPAQAAPTNSNGDDPHSSNGKGDSSSDRRPRDDKSRDRGDRDKDRDRSRDRRRRDRSRDRYGSRRGSPDSVKTPRSEAGSHRSTRRRSRSRDDHRDRHSRRGRGGGDGDYYRGGRGGGARSRSRSPGGNFYRPRDDRRDYRDRRDRRGGDDDARRGGGRTPRADRPEREKTPPALTEDERDRRTVFVQQLAARLRTRDLKEFFEKIGPVSEAQIVKDRVSNRSKGYAYSPLFMCHDQTVR